MSMTTTPLPAPAATGSTATPNRKQRIIVPTRVINGGLDFKFETDPYDVKLHGLMTPQHYTDVMTQLNDRLKPSRATKVDVVLLGTGVTMIPLAIWGVRHSAQTKKRKKLLLEFIDEFNRNNPTLFARWNRRPQSYLSIERKQVGDQQLGEGVFSGVAAVLPSHLPTVNENRLGDTSSSSGMSTQKNGNMGEDITFRQIVPYNEQPTTLV